VIILSFFKALTSEKAKPENGNMLSIQLEYTPDPGDEFYLNSQAMPKPALMRYTFPYKQPAACPPKVALAWQSIPDH
jgi:hypothetical protein